MSDGPDESSDCVVSEAPSGCRWVRAAGTLSRTARDTLVLLPEGGKDQTPLVVSGSAALLWELLADPIMLSELAAELAAIYEVEASGIEVGLAPVLEGLHTAGAIECSP